jgi:hypothetical protein
MAQIAQQDNLVIELTGAVSAMDSTVKNKLIDCIKGGTIADVIIISVEAANKVCYNKVVGWVIDNTTETAPKYSVALCVTNTAATNTIIALN